VLRNITELHPHPENARIYGDTADSDLVESIREKGILTPLLITHDSRIISGHRRYDAARKVGLMEVPVVLYRSDDELDILEALIESNRQRDKDGLIIGREYTALRRIIEERESRQGQRNDINGTSVNQFTEVQKPSHKAAEQLGVSHTTASRAARVVEAIDRLEEQGKAREAGQLRTTVRHNVGKAYNQAQEAGVIPQSRPRDEPKPKEYITLIEWSKMDEAARFSALHQAGDRRFNKQETDNIEWAKWSWNPVTGCKHNCPYCYARDIAMRFYEQKFEPALIPERLTAPLNTPVPPAAQTDIGYKNVFTCSMADLFGRWVPREWIEAVLDVVTRAPEWNFLFLTKFPIRMAEFEFPDNAWVGTSVDAQARVANAERAFRNVRAKVKWLSCEPLLEPLQFTDLSMFQWIVLGGASSSTQTPEWRPPRAWINAIEDQAHAAGCQVYEKTNLIERIREYPGYEPAPVVLPDELRYLASDSKA